MAENDAAGAFQEGKWVPKQIGASIQGPPWLIDLDLVDLDANELMDVVACKGRANMVFWIRQSEKGFYQEE